MSDCFGEENICVRCNRIFTDKWIVNKTYKGIDRHHNPPEFISNFLKESWSGEFYYLCRDCHVELHREIRRILHKNSNSLKFINSDDWLLKKMTINQIKKAKDEIYLFTKKWVEDKDDTTTT
jgi:hypothetical protein